MPTKLGIQVLLNQIIYLSSDEPSLCAQIHLLWSLLLQNIWFYFYYNDYCIFYYNDYYIRLMYVSHIYHYIIYWQNCINDIFLHFILHLLIYFGGHACHGVCGGLMKTCRRFSPSIMWVGARTQIIRLGNKCFRLLCHLVGPSYILLLF